MHESITHCMAMCTSFWVRSISSSLSQLCSFSAAWAWMYKHPWPANLATSLGVHVNDADRTGTVRDFDPPPAICRNRKGKLLSFPIATWNVDLISPRTSSSVISEWILIFPQSPLAAREERCLPLGIGMILPFPQKSSGKHTMFLSHETNRGAFSFPFLEMSEVRRFLP